MTGSDPSGLGRVLAIDYGERRVGLAIRRPPLDFVSGLPTVDRKALKRPLAAEIAAVVAEHEVDRVVIGIPFSMSGEEGTAAAAARALQAELTALLDVPIDEWDERLTTEAARRVLRDSGHSEIQMKGKLDQLSAVLMLEGYLKRAGR